jgi:alkylation response protein AidB-like acyl-CoA dehydrogenase
MELYEELARADASVAWCVWNANTNWTTARLSREAAHVVFDDPEHMLANSTQPRGRAVLVDGGYRVSGRWPLVSGCQVSTWMILLCVVHDGEEPLKAPNGAPELRFMLLPTTDCEIVDTWTAGGLRGTGSHDVIVRHLFVPTTFGSYHTDRMVLLEPRYACPLVARITSGLAVMALGIARAAIEALIDLAQQKRSAGRTSVLRQDRLAQTQLAEAEALVSSARLYLSDTVQRVWHDVLLDREPPIEARAKVRLAAWHAVTSAVRAVDLVYLTGGATSLYAACPIERAFRDVHAFPQHYAVHQSGLEPIGQVLYGLEPEFEPGRTRF